jgi:hypothetical protein
MKSGMKLLALTLGALLLPIAAHASQWGFAINNPTTAVDPNTGYSIRTSGSGVFDDVAGTIKGGGSYSIADSSGKVIEHGTWTATFFVGFTPQGGTTPGIQGGVLNILVTLNPVHGDPRPGQLMTITCPFEADEGTFDEADDSTLVGNFTVPAGGITVFRLVKP